MLLIDSGIKPQYEATTHGQAVCVTLFALLDQLRNSEQVKAKASVKLCDVGEGLWE